MAEAVGLAASVIAIIDLSAKVAVLCLNYSTTVSNARADITRLRSRLYDLGTTLQGVRHLFDDPSSQALATSRRLVDSVDACTSELAQLQSRLDPRKASKAMLTNVESNFLAFDSISNLRQAHSIRIVRFKAAGSVISKGVQDWTEDPILASILISVAQKQAHPSISNSSNNATDFLPRSSYTASFLPRLLVTNQDDIENIHLYEALVPGEFLRKFDQPKYRSPDGIVIKYVEIPFKPYDSLGDRVITLLLKSPFLEHRKTMDSHGKVLALPEMLTENANAE